MHLSLISLINHHFHKSCCKFKANIVSPDQSPLSATFDLGLYCLSMFIVY